MSAEATQSHCSHIDSETIASTAQSNLIVKVISHERTLHDNYGLPKILNHVAASQSKHVKQAVCDRGH